MGQYYKAIILKEGTNKPAKAFTSWDYQCGAKLMEHSYIRNPFVGRVEKQLSPEGEYYKSPLVWGGDYADPEVKDEDETTLFCLSSGKEEKGPKDSKTKKYLRYLVNHTQKLYVDKNKVKADSYGYRINPLPLLTAEGNGRGGGDYHGTNLDLIGSWARNIISTESAISSFKKEGYKELIPAFGDE